MSLFDSFISKTESLGVHDMLSSADVIAVGFSGGADSTALLHLLKECYANAEIHALHVNHMIRGENAHRDEEHCREKCEKLGIPFISRALDVPRMAEEMKLGIEEAARRARYSAFDEYLAELEGAGKSCVLATAHNADDNLETVIFNLIRGSGSRGMGGIAPVRGRYVRPILCYTSAEIRAFCADEGFDYVTDETNSDTKYTRNLIRSEVIPHLREIVPSCAQSALSASALIRRDDEYLCRLAYEAVGDEKATSADAEVLRGLDDAILSRALLSMYTNARGGRKDFGAVHLDSCISLIRASSAGEISLPGRMVMKMSGGTVSFRTAEEKTPDPVFSEVLLRDFEEIRGKKLFFDFPEAGFSLCLSDGSLPEPEKLCSGENIYKISIHTTLSFGKIIGSVSVRNRLPGDRIRMGGMTRRVKKLFCAARTQERSSVPIFCDEAGIFYVPGIGVRDGMRDKDTQTIRISYWR